jgi:hypothetical protein
MQTSEVHPDDIQRSMLGMWSITLRRASLAELLSALDPHLPYVVLEDVGAREQRWRATGIPGNDHPGPDLRTRNLRFDLLLGPAELVAMTDWLEANAGTLFLWQAHHPPPAEQSMRHVTGHQRLRLAEQLGIDLFVDQPRRSAPALISSPSYDVLSQAVNRLGPSSHPASTGWVPQPRHQA